MSVCARATRATRSLRPQASVPTLSPRPSCFCLSPRENMAQELRFHRASRSAGCSWNAWLAFTRASSFSYRSRESSSQTADQPAQTS